MNTTTLYLASKDSEIQDIAVLANEIWHEHFTPIIGLEQVEYMVDKFQSYPAMKDQVDTQGYEYYQIYSGHTLAGYMGIRQDEDSMFLSKLYVKKDFRGQHLATEAFTFLINLCKERSLPKIWLTCNKYNENTLSVYHHLGFTITEEQVADIGRGFVMDDYILTYEVK